MCRSFLTPTYINPDTQEPEFYGRGNIGVCTVNLADAALSAQKQYEKLNIKDNHLLIDLFWNILDERCELCHDVQRVRFERLYDTPAEVNPILWCDGALARLDPDEKIGPTLSRKHFTSSLGYTGLYEATLVLCGKSHTDPEGKILAKEIMQFLNDKCARWKLEEPIDYSVYGTPIESTTYKFAKNLKRRFGEIPGITDRDFVTNSYHVFVEEPISPFDKIDIEAEFQRLSPGGCISYIETSHLDHNLDVILTLMQYMYEKIAYCEFNTKLDTCELCGYQGEIDLVEIEPGHHEFVCPQCGNSDFTKMNVARRVCG